MPVSGPPSHAAPTSTANYLLFSDVHLGADLVQHSRPWTVSRLREVLRLDRDLGAMLAHYRTHPDSVRPWTLVIAGDLIDFVGMSIAPALDLALETPMNVEEHTHGLGSAQDHASQKMRAVAERHDLVFRELALFVADGHSLVLVRGNHDVDFYWQTARDAFVKALVERAPGLRDESARAAFEARVEFRHWFYYVEGLLYVEHGHQYDETCSHHHVLLPLSPRDPRRIAYSFSDILMRYVVRPTRGIGVAGHDDKDLGHYLRLVASMGWKGGARLAYRFGRAVLAMFQNWRDQIGARAHELRAENERRLHQVAERFRMSVDKLRELAALSAKPVTGRFFAILRSVFLDLMGAITVLSLLVAVLLLFKLLNPVYVAPVAVLLGAGIYVWMKSSRVLDPSTALRRRAGRIAELLPTRFVVMGHTHRALTESIAEDVTYVNLGGWAVDDLDHEQVAPAAYTHLVIQASGDRLQAELRRWCSGVGPTLVRAIEAPFPAAVLAATPLGGEESATVTAGT
jgi:UDP-2,3-diacylglucosamine pyrophosphatase LpxH